MILKAEYAPDGCESLSPVAAALEECLDLLKEYGRHTSRCDGHAANHCWCKWAEVEEALR